MSLFPVHRGTRRTNQVDRILVAGVDVTHFRGATIPTPGYRLTTPFGYGSSDPIAVPKVHGYYEQLGVGELAWIRNGVRVEYQRVNRSTLAVEAVDYVGRVWHVEVDAGVPLLHVEGDLIGDASKVWKPDVIRWKSRDGGTLAFNAVESALRKRFTPRLGIDTGIELVETGGQFYDAYLRDLIRRLQKRNGDTFTLMPETWGEDEYELRKVDRSTVSYSLYVDKKRAVAKLVDTPVDNVFYGQCITPDGEVVRNAKLPGIVPGRAPTYPIADGSSFGLGTTNADTVNGSGITVLHTKLIGLDLMARKHQGDTYTEATERAVNRLKRAVRDGDVAMNGTMTESLWASLFNVTATGYSMNQARIHPLVEDRRVADFFYTSNGSLRRINPDYDETVPRVERPIEFGAGFTRREMLDWIEGEQARMSGPNWTGTITLRKGVAGVVGTHNPGDPAPASSSIVFARDFRPDTNLWLPNFQGGLLVYISDVQVSSGGDVTLTVDTHHRDALEASEILRRNRDSKMSPSRQFRRDNRKSRGSHDGRITWEAGYGYLPEDVECPADEWTVVVIPVGQAGKIGQIDLRTKADPAAFCVAVLADAPGDNPERLKRQLDNRVPDPWSVDDNDETVWAKNPDLDDWFENRKLRLVLGNEKQPCGYGRRKHTNRKDKTTSAPVVGWHRGPGFDYQTFGEPVVYLCIHPDRDTVLEAGQLFYKTFEDSV